MVGAAVRILRRCDGALQRLGMADLEHEGRRDRLAGALGPRSCAFAAAAGVAAAVGEALSDTTQNVATSTGTIEILPKMDDMQTSPYRAHSERTRHEDRVCRPRDGGSRSCSLLIETTISHGPGRLRNIKTVYVGRLRYASHASHDG